MSRRVSKSTQVILAQRLFYLNAAIWFVIAILGVIRLLRSSNPAITLIVVAGLLFGNAGAMLVSGLGLRYQNKWWYRLAVVILAINILLTFTDQFGVLDLLTLVLDLVLLGLLVATRKQYFQKVS